MIRELSPGEIALSYSSYAFGSVDPGTRIIGQERAIGLLALGLRTDRIGYNIFLSGEDGSGRLTAVLEEIGRISGDTSDLRDAAYAYSPDEAEPTVLLFPKGLARKFQEELSLLERGQVSMDEIRARWPDERIGSFLSSLPPAESNADAYKLNIVIDRGAAARRPAIIETHPTHKSLFGFAEKDKAPHLSIRIGSYQAAAGGFLILNAEEVAEDEELWKTLKRYIEMTHRALTSSGVRGEMMGAVRPLPIPLNTKVILIGSDDTYDMLAEKDEQFLRLFKICPEFDYQMERNEKNIRGTVAYLKRNGKDLLPLSNSAYQEILRYSSWFSEDRNMLTTQLSILGDLENEADIAARKKSKSEIDGEAVKEAIEKRGELASLTEDRINREIKDGEILISLEGMLVGTLNGLAVIDRGLASFGTPTVISATAAPGNEGIINIEHEAGLSGGIHDKGLLILEGYLRHRYARTFPLSLYAGICFEQNYGEVDGDSASSAELFALLSAIGEIPLRQDIAVTGSVNQMGKLQPVGAINEKIEGFYNACKTSGLTGKQGVIIPMQNIQSLILPYEIEEKIGEGMFHIYAISSIDEGMELLSERKAGERGAKGLFPVGTINRAIEDGLKRLYASSQKN